ncbi:MAG: threonine--tRNA ligase [Candidatus Woykebacteria bacterium RBG_16_44_10]|uniref:Threonine--tRNA ligase n=1 Tax=Candidatus Woykebacteria bacterium RBG_16_44_10 TaxID=1802597 RepID=A0A1G1WF78_9BACT|nr:MAG: threonine--tRNA ligase [Candidatus Woykebacteria bacterium RBG_16_44_10]
MVKDYSILRHSAAHLLAAAVQKLWPKTKFGIGPVTRDGFYYDFDLPINITEKDLEKIEKKMGELKVRNLEFKRIEMPLNEAVKLESKRGQMYKSELLAQIKETGDTKVDQETKIERVSKPKKKVTKVSYYQAGEFVDLCTGPHVKTTADIGHFKLLNTAGAYWRGSEKNKMLTRIYGVVWETKDELNEYLKHLEEAKKRDHKRIGAQLGLFTFLPQAPGMPFWYPKGLSIINQLKEFVRAVNTKYGFQEISTPLLAKKEVWETSGHWKLFREDMFTFNIDKQTYALKPMNCPGTLLLYNTRHHSYKELPLKYADLDTLHRYEESGTLNGLLRVREFSQDDAHVFLTQNQIKDSIGETIEMAKEVFARFNFKPTFYLATRPDKAIGDTPTWQTAENYLEEALVAKKVDYYLKPKDGAFYGPKIDLHIDDSLGRNWQLATIQLDFSMPKSFKATYTDEKGKKATPIMIHKAILGSFERFVAILIEHYGGALPTWLSPVQATVIPITERSTDYATIIRNTLLQNNFRSEIDNRAETMQARIRDAQLQKIPYMIIVGDKEKVQKKVSVRSLKSGDEGTLSLDEFIVRLNKEVAH